MNFFSNNKQSKNYFLVGTIGASVGLLASFLQAIQTINHYKTPENPLSCNINSVFNCSGVFDAWQSSFFGFSNSLMCMAFFAISIGILISGFSGSKIHKNLRLIIHFFTLFFLGFGAWYLWSSAYVIGALCIYCIFCYAGVIVLNWAWMRINVDDLPIDKKFINKIKVFIANDNDSVFWITWATATALMFVIKFA
jgi:uncharacterized membrane protein